MNVMYADNCNQALAAVFGRPSQNLQRELERDVTGYISRLGRSSMGLATRVKDRFYDMTYGAFARKVESIRNVVTHAWETDGILYLNTISKLQNAKSTMRRYVMAHPRTREMYHDNRLEGYLDDYQDVHPGKVGVTHIDYRNITNGLVLRENNETHSRYFIEQEKPRYAISLNAKAAVQNTWRRMNALLEDGVVDFTSTENNLIG